MKGSIRDRCLRAKEWFPEGSFRRNDNNVEFPMPYVSISWQALWDSLPPNTLPEAKACGRATERGEAAWLENWRLKRRIEKEREDFEHLWLWSAKKRPWKVDRHCLTEAEEEKRHQGRVFEAEDIERKEALEKLRRQAEREDKEAQDRVTVSCYQSTGIRGERRKAFEKKYHEMFLSSPSALSSSDQRQLRWILIYQGGIDVVPPSKIVRIEHLRYLSEAIKDVRPIPYKNADLFRIAFFSEEDRTRLGHFYLVNLKQCEAWCQMRLGVRVTPRILR